MSLMFRTYQNLAKSFSLGLIMIIANSRLVLADLPPISPPSSQLPEGATFSTDSYTLGAGDRIQITVLEMPHLSGEYLILVDGTIVVPLLGTLNVKGLTLEQVSQSLSEGYATYLKYPEVTVNVITPRPLQIAVSGEVNSPGTYTIAVEPGQKFPVLTDLVKQSGGLTAVADISQVEVRRMIQGKEQILYLNLWELLQGSNFSQDPTLRDGDIVFIPTKHQSDPKELRQLIDANFGIQANQELNVSVVGEVYRPGSYQVTPEQLTTTVPGSINLVRRQPPRLTAAIQLAGGIKPLADIREIKIDRYNRDGTKQTITVNLWNLVQTGNPEEDIILQAGDTIVVPSAKNISPEESQTLASVSFAPDQIRVNIVGEVIRSGTVEVPANTPLNQAILAAGGFEKRRANEAVVELIRLNPNGTVTKKNLKINFAQGITEENNPILLNNDIVIVNRNFLTSTTDTINTIVSPIGASIGLINLLNIFNLY